mmetsp:Transcript_35005/g.84584  ORF Transcript_35005/g.84584 Transcript_35005/m.84584 type:complete len:279 (-) Transcript_35005:22-858(-)
MLLRIFQRSLSFLLLRSGRGLGLLLKLFGPRSSFRFLCSLRLGLDLHLRFVCCLGVLQCCGSLGGKLFESGSKLLGLLQFRDGLIEGRVRHLGRLVELRECSRSSCQLSFSHFRCSGLHGPRRLDLGDFGRWCLGPGACATLGTGMLTARLALALALSLVGAIPALLALVPLATTLVTLGFPPALALGLAAFWFRLALLVFLFPLRRAHPLRCARLVPTAICFAPFGIPPFRVGIPSTGLRPIVTFFPPRLPPTAPLRRRAGILPTIPFLIIPRSASP